MNIIDDDKTLPTTTSRLKTVTISVGEHVSSRIDKHIRSLKFLDNKNGNKQKWVALAIQEKLNNNSTGIDKIPRNKLLNIQLDDELYATLEQRIDFIKKFRKYSAKQLILEAILEKLEREEAATAELVEKKQSY